MACRLQVNPASTFWRGYGNIVALNSQKHRPATQQKFLTLADAPFKKFGLYDPIHFDDLH
jgi:hypothetical protein